ncbi:MAG: hypothetical protein Q4A46_04855 [Clostridia bacterium]|nr:hypothetical protein [Clostridia bacterium]
MFFSKKKVTFDKAAKFNYELDTNENLKTALKNLSLRRSEMSKNEYLIELLSLFNEEGFDLSLKELDMLLLLRKKTDQLLLEQINRHTYRKGEQNEW